MASHLMETCKLSIVNTLPNLKGADRIFSPTTLGYFFTIFSERNDFGVATVAVVAAVCVCVCLSAL